MNSNDSLAGRFVVGLIAFLIGALVALSALIFISLAVQFTWNESLATIGLKELGFMQAAALTILARLLLMPVEVKREPAKTNVINNTVSLKKSSKI